jgi:glucose-1-phosphate thymidylyltransferase
LKKFKGIILAGGSGSRLFPITKGLSKQLLPIYNKPMIYYPLSTLMQAKVKDILIITNKEYLNFYRNILGNGKKLGINISYAIQKKPQGIAQAFLIGKKFIGKSNVILILGDNIFYGPDMTKILTNAKKSKGATIFGFYVSDPERFGVVSFKKNLPNKVETIEEKPTIPKSNYAVTGLYFYDNDVVNIAKNLKPSYRGELEITDINNEYLRRKKLYVKKFKKGYAWLDTGTFTSLIDASNFIKILEERQSLLVGCLEEISLNNKWITKQQLLKVIKNYPSNEYSNYIKNILNENNKN